MSLKLSEHLPFRIAVLSNLMKQGSSDFFVKDTKMTGRDWRVLAIIGLQDSITPAEVSAITGMDRATVTRSIQHLEKLQLVSKKKHLSDGRSRLIAITEKGQQTYQALIPQMSRNGDAFQQVLSDGEFRLFLELIDKLQSKAIDIIKHNP
jgi:DNA-binding MarR family transcriptional regulator